jgi:hypothetical protein
MSIGRLGWTQPPLRDGTARAEFFGSRQDLTAIRDLHQRPVPPWRGLVLIRFCETDFPLVTEDNSAVV